MRTKYIIKGVIKNELVYFIGVRKQHFFGEENFIVRNCSLSIDNATQYNSYEDALEIIREYQLSKFAPFPICPICGEDYDGHPALSRKDNKTEICPNCGVGEAFMKFIEYKKKATIK